MQTQTHVPAKVEQLETVAANRLEQANIDALRFQLLLNRLSEDISTRLYPGVSYAIAHGGKILHSGHLGAARLPEQNEPGVPATDQTLWLLYSQTKPLISCAIWILLERGLLNLNKQVAHYLPAFAKHGKTEVSVYHLLTHQGGFPNATVPPDCWIDRQLLLDSVCDFQPECEPGLKVHYHASAGHWVQALLIERVSGSDYRHFVSREVLEPLGLKNTRLGVKGDQFRRLAGAYELTDEGTHNRLHEFDNERFYQAGVPSGGAYSTAEDLAMFYQMLLLRGELNGKRILSPRMVDLATRDHTAERADEFFGIPMHRGLGVHSRGLGPIIRGLGSLASPSCFGHGGVGSSYSWGDPVSGVSFSYITNSRLSEPRHSWRLEEIMNLVHSSLRT